MKRLIIPVALLLSGPALAQQPPRRDLQAELDSALAQITRIGVGLSNTIVMQANEGSQMAENLKAATAERDKLRADLAAMTAECDALKAAASK